jgi:hypothetical protein
MESTSLDENDSFQYVSYYLPTINANFFDVGLRRAKTHRNIGLSKLKESVFRIRIRIRIHVFLAFRIQ